MARVVLAGVQPSELPRMSFALMAAMVRVQRQDRRRERRRERRQRAGSAGWDWKGIPAPADPHAPPEKDHFVQYGLHLGLSPEAVESEWQRQTAKGGW